jgi:arylsulfatase A-like enzyme
VKPNIFLFVIDSLRRDYLAPYNGAVNFTPGATEFARDGVVFENAFTRYGGTGLSEPSIWAGGLMLHKQYVLPFAPMNSLEKLLQTDGYDVLISRDSILTTIAGRSEGWDELDKSRTNMSYRFCDTLAELRGRLAARGSSTKPLFVYTQPQDIHVSVIQREGAKPVDSRNYGRFYAPYASRVARMDACFGEFVQFLKSRGLYDQSLVILTSDHGDALGEDGRWGHAYTIFPEVVEIPLLVHLPRTLARKTAFDTKAVAFSADITPSLYYLLGHRPVREHPVFGRPLFSDSESGLATAPPDGHLVASSYGAAYGILSSDGTSLYIADAGEYRDYWFDLSESSGGRAASRTEQLHGRELIRRKIQEINRFYGLPADGGEAPRTP